MTTTHTSFDILVNQIQQTHRTLQESAVKAINKHLTIRNWLTGFYIVEFEQKGEGRAQYGTRLLDKFGETLQTQGLGARNLKLYRQFYLTYPQIGKILPTLLVQIGANLLLTEQSPIVQLPIAQFNNSSTEELQVPPDKLISRLSYTHLVLLNKPYTIFYCEN